MATAGKDPEAGDVPRQLGAGDTAGHEAVARGAGCPISGSAGVAGRRACGARRSSSRARRSCRGVHRSWYGRRRESTGAVPCDLRTDRSVTTPTLLSRLLRPSWGGHVAIGLTIWGFIAAISLSNHALQHRAAGGACPMCIAELGAYALWVLATPLALRAGQRDGPFDGRVVAGHVAFGLVVVLAIGVGRGLFHEFLGHAPADRHGSARWLVQQSYAQVHIDGLAYAALYAVGRMLRYAREARAQRERELRLQAQLSDARLRALQTQLDPHFLFNTLNTVSGLVESDPAGTRRVVARLSDLLRATLTLDRDASIPLVQELSLLQPYLDILDARFGDRLHVSVEVEDEALDGLVPTFFLQPLVENAVKHGAERVDRPCTIEVSASLSGRRLVLRVLDDGPGFATSQERTPSTGVGLANTRARLAELFGDYFCLDLRERPTGGVAVEVEIPFVPSDVPALAVDRVR